MYWKALNNYDQHARMIKRNIIRYNNCFQPFYHCIEFHVVSFIKNPTFNPTSKLQWKNIWRFIRSYSQVQKITRITIRHAFRHFRLRWCIKMEMVFKKLIITILKKCSQLCGFIKISYHCFITVKCWLVKGKLIDSNDYSKMKKCYCQLYFQTEQYI